MNVYRESAILDGADDPTKKMLALWHQLCRDVLNGDLEVGVASRHECDLTKDAKGELNTALPLRVDGNPMLVLLFENTSSVEEVILTHELGHWILKLQGIKSIQKLGRPHSNEEILFNSMCQHPALYALQRSIGHDPQHEIDERARHDLSLMKPEPVAKVSAERALLCADDILNCSVDISEALFARLYKYFPKTAKCVRGICSIRDSSDPAQLDSQPAFVRAVRRLIGFGLEWTTVDEIPGLKALTKETN